VYFFDKNNGHFVISYLCLILFRNLHFTTNRVRRPLVFLLKKMLQVIDTLQDPKYFGVGSLTLYTCSLNVVVKWLTLLFRIFVFRRSRFQTSARRPASPADVSVVLPQSLLAKYRVHISKLDQDRFLPKPFQFNLHLSPYHSTLVLVTEKAP
jgi:hypothetical protein